MIRSKEDYQEYLRRDMAFYYACSRKVRFFYWLFRDPYYFIAKYIRLLRREEYHGNCGNGSWYHTLMCWQALTRKNILGNKLGFKIPRNCMGPGLTIYHHGQIIVNEAARVGADCQLHGGNCIGNNGKVQIAPQIGDRLDLGFGACIIGGVTLGDGVTVGANAVVVKSEPESDITLVGVPARKK